MQEKFFRCRSSRPRCADPGRRPGSRHSLRLPTA
jgi:hypothetical protein